jgi:Domain of unknown function (DUF4265)
LWAYRLDATTAAIDNIPFYAYGLAYADRVRISPEPSDGVHDVLGVVQRGGHSTYRIIWGDPSSKGETECLRFLRLLEAKGCGFERGQGMLYAIDVPPDIDANDVYRLLEDSEKRGISTFEEGFFSGRQQRSP